MIKTKMASPTTNGQQNANNLEPHEPTHKAKKENYKRKPSMPKQETRKTPNKKKTNIEKTPKTLKPQRIHHN